MKIIIFTLLVAMLLLLDKTTAAPSANWQGRYLDREYAIQLFNYLQEYLSEANGQVPSMAMKRNSEIINSLLALPKSLADIGR